MEGLVFRNRSRAFAYAVYGALFGAAFPIFSTLFYASSELGSITEFARAQRTVSLLWIIDTAPAFLGAFAWLAGRRQDAVESLYTQLEATSHALEQANQTMAAKNTELENANTALIDASRLKSQFLANMSHELRTPLNAVIGFSRIVLKKTVSMIPERQAKNLQTIHDSGKHLLEMVNDLLDIERIEAGMLRVSFTTVNLTSMLTDVVGTLTPAAVEKGLTLACDPGREPLNLRTDAVRLRQVLDNLTSNAIKYSDTGTVRVRAELRPDDAPDELRLVIEDQGLGIPESHLGKIFDAFHQVDGSSTRAQGGVGLGLHLVRRLVELLEGTISVVSTVGKGSSFRVSFPVSMLQTTQPDAAVQSLLAPTGSGPLVLVIDDQVEAIEILRNELLEAGYQVEAATSGEAGLAKAAAIRPSVILLDMVMPNLDGWGVLKRLRADPDLSSTPVIITSMLDDAPRAWDLGIVGWLTKPVDPDHLASVFRRLGVGAAADVLVVEDDPATRTMIVDHLVELGIHPRTAIDGRAAVEAVDTKLPRAVVLDLMLPHLDGFQVLEHLRTLRNGHDVPVVVYTAMDLTVEERKRLNGGVVEVIGKGKGDVDHVVTCVRRALARTSPKEVP